MGLLGRPFEPEFEGPWVENSCLARRRCCAETHSHRLSEAEPLGTHRASVNNTQRAWVHGILLDRVTQGNRSSKDASTVYGLMGTNQENTTTSALALAASSPPHLSLSLSRDGNISKRDGGRVDERGRERENERRRWKFQCETWGGSRALC
jgi:hypothetical protein